MVQNGRRAGHCPSVHKGSSIAQFCLFPGGFCFNSLPSTLAITHTSCLLQDMVHLAGPQMKIMLMDKETVSHIKITFFPHKWEVVVYGHLSSFFPL